MQLLISVTSVSEAAAALEGGADIIDVKNPAEGPLGAANAAALAEVCRLAAPSGRPTSAALGDSIGTAGALALAGYGAATLGVRYVKLGLSTADIAHAISGLHAIREAVHLANPHCGVIAVGYADAAAIGAIPWQTLPEIARAARIEGCMIDTAVKKGQRLFDHISTTALRQWLANCREAGLLCALAGSLQAADLPALRHLQPDVIGFRTAACDQNDRLHGHVTAHRVETLHTAMK